jgi:hypothetical protein
MMEASYFAWSRGPITVVAFSPDGQRILTGSGERVVRDDNGRELTGADAPRLWTR